MSNNAPEQTAQEQPFADIFSRLHEQDIEQFYAHYQLWVLRRRVPAIEKQLAVLRANLAEHQQRLKNLRPSALALAVLARLQSNGVNNIDVLDLMLDRGENWLDRMMQRLDYCEQVEDFIQGDYTQWCIKSLEGAYDWMDSLLGSLSSEEKREQEPTADESAATEELLLQKLSLDDDEELLATTLTQPAVQPEVPDESAISETTPIDLQIITSPSDESPATQQEDDAADQSISISSPTPTVEPQTSSDSEPEFASIDSRELETSDEAPAPWYSVEVTASGASSTPTDTEQTNTMDDWIKVLQAENVAKLEADQTEVITYNTAELLTSADQETGTLRAEPDRAELDASIEVPTSIDAVTNSPEHVEPELSAETASEPVSLSPTQTETAQEQSSFPSEEEPFAAIDNESELPSTEILPPETRSEDRTLHSDEAVSVENGDGQDELPLAEVFEETTIATISSESEESPLAEDRSEENASYTATPDGSETRDEQNGVSAVVGNIDLVEDGAREVARASAFPEAESAQVGAVPENDELKVDEKHTSGQILPPRLEERMSNQASEQSENIDEETQPFALKEVQTAQQAQIGEALASPADEISEIQEETISAKNATSSTSEETTGSVAEQVSSSSEAAETAVSAVREVSPSGGNERPEAPVSAEKIMPDSQSMNSAVHRAETVTNRELTHAQIERPSPARPGVPRRKPSKKPGFWRRLFSFGRKRKR